MVQAIEDLDRRTTRLEQVQGETVETLKWVVTKLGRIQAVQDEHTVRLERVETRLDKVEARLGKVEARLEKVETRLEKVETRLDSVEGKLDALPRVLAEMIEASEKRLMVAIAER